MEDGLPSVFVGALCKYDTRQLVMAPGRQAPQVCWKEFVEGESRIQKYEVALVQVTPEFSLRPGTVQFDPTQPFVCKDGECKATFERALTEGGKYCMVVRASNNAGASTIVRSTEISVQQPVASQTLLVALLSVFFALALLVAAAVASRKWKALREQHREAMRVAREREQLKRQLITTTELVFGKSLRLAARDTEESLFEAAEVAFVFTDIEESTSMALADPEAYHMAQEIHDTVIRRQIVEHGGYEVNTQGDAFEIALPSVAAAVRLCMDVQQALLQVEWSDAVCRMPTCAPVYDLEGILFFCGPRVRMGIHLAKAGTFSKTLHVLTQHIQFEGEAQALAAEVGDCCDGGQVIMTQDAFAALDGKMQQLGVRLNNMGVFQFQKSAEPISIYEVLPSTISEMPTRSYPPQLRNCLKVKLGMGLRVAEPPLPNANGELTIVAATYAELEGDALVTMHELLASYNQVCCRFISSPAASTLPSGAHGSCDGGVTRVWGGRQAFGGFELATLNEDQVTFIFQDPVAAVKFGLLVQVALMTHTWALSEAELEVVRGKQGNILFRGPRVGILVHTTSHVELKGPTSTHVSPPGPEFQRCSQRRHTVAHDLNPDPRSAGMVGLRAGGRRIGVHRRVAVDIARQL
jgi:class 3 adenylate cyclase